MCTVAGRLSRGRRPPDGRFGCEVAAALPASRDLAHEALLMNAAVIASSTPWTDATERSLATSSREVVRLHAC